MISALLLAAGESRRMGRENKLLLDYKEQFMIRYVAEQILLSEIDEVVVVTGYQPDAVQKALSDFEVKFAHNPDYFSGQTSSIKVGVQNLSKGSQGFIICLGDMPILKTMHYNAVINKLKSEKDSGLTPIVRPVYKGVPGHPVGFDMAFKSDILSCTDSDGCKSVIQANKEHFIPWPIANEAFYRDVDTKTDYYKL